MSRKSRSPLFDRSDHRVPFVSNLRPASSAVFVCHKLDTDSLRLPSFGSPPVAIEFVA